MWGVGQLRRYGGGGLAWGAGAVGLVRRGVGELWEWGVGVARVVCALVSWGAGDEGISGGLVAKTR